MKSLQGTAHDFTRPMSPRTAAADTGIRGWIVALAAILMTVSAPAPAASPRPSGLASPSDGPALLATLNTAEAPIAQRVLACQNLALIGGSDAIPAFAALLDHPQLAVHARNGLEVHPDPAAATALRSALPNLRGGFLVGVVNSLGVRRDPQSVEALIALALDPSKGAAPESLLALGRIASPPATAAVTQTLKTGPAALWTAAAEGCLLAAEAMHKRGDAPSALALFESARSAEVPLPLRLAATRGAILAAQDRGIPLLLEQFRSSDPTFSQLAARVARELPGAAVAQALAAELGRASNPVQVLILGALSDRADLGVSGAVERLAVSTSPAVRIAALEALGTLGTPYSIPILLRSLDAPGSGSDTSPEVEAAVASLSRLADAGTDAAILTALPQSSPSTRARLSSILGYRNAQGATTALLRQASDPDPIVSKAAFDALAAVATVAELPQVIRVAVSRTDTSVRDRAERSVYGICLKQADASSRSAPLAAAFREIELPSARASLLQVMAMLGDPAGSRAIAAACEDPLPETRDTALRLLVNWPDSSPVPTLLRIFKTTANDVHRNLALRGIVTLSTLWAGDQAAPSDSKSPRRPPAESVTWLSEANSALRNQPDEKKIILSGLGDLNCAEGLRMLKPYLDDPAVRHEAELATLRAIKGMTTAEDRATARPLLEKISTQTQDADTRRQALEVLGKQAS